MRRPDDVTDESSLASYLFVDRVPDSKALTDSLRAHLDRVRADAIDSTHNENVLTFYGQGGMGKTRLSRRLEHWLRGELGDATEWGPRPIGPSLVWQATSAGKETMTAIEACLVRPGRQGMWNRVRNPPSLMASRAKLRSIEPVHERSESLTPGRSDRRKHAL